MDHETEVANVNWPISPETAATLLRHSLEGGETGFGTVLACILAINHEMEELSVVAKCPGNEKDFYIEVVFYSVDLSPEGLKETLAAFSQMQHFCSVVFEGMRALGEIVNVYNFILSLKNVCGETHACKKCSWSGICFDHMMRCPICNVSWEPLEIELKQRHERDELERKLRWDQ